jgi:FkbM family methyltransferase
LLEKFSAESRVSLMNIAAGATNGELYMSMDANPLAPTHHVVTDPGSGVERMIPVAVRSAASVVEENPDLFPNLVKIDVEGHEGAVMDGMLPLLPDKRLHCIGIEVHFGLLDSRGEGHRPKQMEQVLKAHGFQVRWTDPSHLLAIR